MNRKLWLKRVIVLLIIILLTGCSPDENKIEEPLVFSMLYNQQESSPYDENWLILKEYQDRKNVVFDVIIGDDADYEKDIQRVLKSDSPPDVLLKIWPDNVTEYVNDGLLLPVSDYESLMPYYSAYIKAHDLQAEVDKLRLENGKYYILPGYQRPIQVQQWIYRKDLFEKHDLGVPSTYDELFDALVTLKALYPDSDPISACYGGAHLFAMMGAGYGIPAGWNGTQHYDSVSETWQYSPATDNNKAMLDYLHRLYEAGLLDPDIFTQSESDFYAKLLDGSTFVTVTWITSGFDNWNQSLAENGISGGAWAPLPVPESTIGLKALPAVNPFRKGLVLSSRVVNKPYFEDLIKFLDWAVYSEEGMTLTTWGVEGITYEETEDGKKFSEDIYSPKNPEGTKDITAAYGLDSFFDLNENEEFEDYKKPDDIVIFLERSLSNGETAKMKPELKLDVVDMDAIAVVEERLQPYVDSSSKSFITGSLSVDEDWDMYIEELKKLGYQTIEEIWHEAWTEIEKK